MVEKRGYRPAGASWLSGMGGNAWVLIGVALTFLSIVAVVRHDWRHYAAPLVALALLVFLAASFLLYYREREARIVAQEKLANAPMSDVQRRYALKQTLGRQLVFGQGWVRMYVESDADDAKVDAWIEKTEGIVKDALGTIDLLAFRPKSTEPRRVQLTYRVDRLKSMLDNIDSLIINADWQP
jgi:hypothetical protein